MLWVDDHATAAGSLCDFHLVVKRSSGGGDGVGVVVGDVASAMIVRRGI